MIQVRGINVKGFLVEKFYTTMELRNQNSSFESLLENDASTTIHIQNLKVILTEMFKTKIFKIANS